MAQRRLPHALPWTGSLGYRPPFDWAAMLGYLAARATPGVEIVTPGGGGRYQRGLRLQGHVGSVVVSLASNGPAVHVEISAGLVPVLAPLLARLRRQFDLDAEPAPIVAHLGADPVLAPLVARRPGLRVPGAVDGFELALRAVLGQQVSVRGASTLAGRLAALLADPVPDAQQGGPTHLPVSAERLAEVSTVSVRGIGLPQARAECVVRLARAVASGEFPELTGAAPPNDATELRRRLTGLPGIGEWTAEYVAMRALGHADAFPHGDLGLRRAMGGLAPAKLRAAAERWRPWRSYAAQHLWAGLARGDR